MTKSQEIAKEIRESDIWDAELLAQLCEEAGMLDEWSAADAENFEAVAFAAAEKLGVEIL